MRELTDELRQLTARVDLSAQVKTLDRAQKRAKSWVRKLDWSTEKVAKVIEKLVKLLSTEMKPVAAEVLKEAKGHLDGYTGTNERAVASLRDKVEWLEKYVGDIDHAVRDPIAYSKSTRRTYGGMGSNPSGDAVFNLQLLAENVFMNARASDSMIFVLRRSGL